jgi:hypothetical protein
VAREELTRVDPTALTAALDIAAEEAAQAVGGFEDHDLLVAGLGLHLRFAGAALVAPVMRPLAHLSALTDTSESLTIRVWDSESTGAPAPVPAGDARNVRGYLGDASAGFLECDESTLSVLDARRNAAYLWVKGAADHGLNRAAPVSSILRSWLALRGVHLVHAAAVGTADGCVLLVGGAGAGKSTATLACVESGLGCLGDDTCLLGPQDPPTVHSLYSSAQAEASTLARVPSLDRAPADGGGKPLAFLPLEALLREAPLRAVAVTRVAMGTDSRLTSATAGEALSAVGPTSVLRMAGPAESTLACLARALEGIPCHHLEVGRDPAGVARAVRALL